MELKKENRWKKDLGKFHQKKKKMKRRILLMTEKKKNPFLKGGCGSTVFNHTFYIMTQYRMLKTTAFGVGQHSYAYAYVVYNDMVSTAEDN